MKPPEYEWARNHDKAPRYQRPPDFASRDVDSGRIIIGRQTYSRPSTEQIQRNLERRKVVEAAHQFMKLGWYGEYDFSQKALGMIAQAAGQEEKGKAKVGDWYDIARRIFHSGTYDRGDGIWGMKPEKKIEIAAQLIDFGFSVDEAATELDIIDMDPLEKLHAYQRGEADPTQRGG